MSLWFGFWVVGKVSEGVIFWDPSSMPDYSIVNKLLIRGVGVSVSAGRNDPVAKRGRIRAFSVFFAPIVNSYLSTWGRPQHMIGRELSVFVGTKFLRFYVEDRSQHSSTFRDWCINLHVDMIHLLHDLFLSSFLYDFY